MTRLIFLCHLSCLMEIKMVLIMYIHVVDSQLLLCFEFCKKIISFNFATFLQLNGNMFLKFWKYM